MSQPNDTNEPSPASSGSHGVAVGWILFYGERMTFDVVFDDRDEAEKYCRAYERKPDIVPVYRSPTLTDEEREAVGFFLEKHRKIQSEGQTYCCVEASPHADAIQGLLGRLA
jgi:hypothetical protein